MNRVAAIQMSLNARGLAVHCFITLIRQRDEESGDGVVETKAEEGLGVSNTCQFGFTGRFGPVVSTETQKRHFIL